MWGGGYESTSSATGASGRIVSPPESPIAAWEQGSQQPHQHQQQQYQQQRYQQYQQDQYQRQYQQRDRKLSRLGFMRRQLPKSRSAVNLATPSSSLSWAASVAPVVGAVGGAGAVAGPSRVLGRGRGEPGARAGSGLLSPAFARRGEAGGAGGRPRSFAQDDLALPSPMPSLAK